MDTWGGLRQLAISANQSLSPSFVRSLLRSKSGVSRAHGCPIARHLIGLTSLQTLALTLTIFPPLLVNTALGFLLFTSHSFFALVLARWPFFHQQHPPSLHQTTLNQSRRELYRFANQREDEESDTESINLQSLIQGPSIIPRHPTLLSAIAGAGAGLLQGAAFTPIENIVR